MSIIDLNKALPASKGNTFEAQICMLVMYKRVTVFYNIDFMITKDFCGLKQFV